MKRRTGQLLLGVALAASAFAASAQAREGRLDRSFGDHGRVVAKNSAMAVGPEGSIALTNGKWVVLLTEDGDRDPRFGRDGSVRVPVRVAGWSFQVTQEAVDSRGRVLLFGTAFPPGHPMIEGWAEPVPISRAAVLRLLPDGRRDPSFGQDGAVLGNFGLPSEGSEVIEQSTGIAAGAVDSLDRPLFAIGAAAVDVPCAANVFIGWAPRAIVRLTASGLLDPAFGEGDGLSPTFLEIEELPGVTLALSAANQPLMGGALGTGCFRGASVIRLSQAGTPLPGYGTAGRRNVPRFKFIAFTPKGGAILERRRYRSEILRRLTPQGQPDPSFGHDGAVILKQPGTNDYPPAAVDSEGRTLIVSSYSLPAAGSRAKRAFIFVERLLSSGKVDRGFGRNGRITVAVPGARNLGILEVALDPEGRLLVFGEVTKPNEFPTGAAVLTRFLLG
jgi:uncharacterized delta-60 repeat protein